MADIVGPPYFEHDPTGGQLTFSLPVRARTVFRYRRARSDHRLLPGGHCSFRPTFSVSIGYWPLGSTVSGSAGATPVASVFGLRRSRRATQVANHESSMHIPM